jgi:hypothetical protein
MSLRIVHVLGDWLAQCTITTVHKGGLRHYSLHFSGLAEHKHWYQFQWYCLYISCTSKYMGDNDTYVVVSSKTSND